MPHRAQSVAGESVSPSITPLRGRFDALDVSLPAEPATTLLGRVQDLQTAADLLRDDTVRLLTITGPGGIGKTRMALRLAHVVQPEFDDGAAFVSLATISDPLLVAAAIAQSLKLRESAGMTPLESICIALMNRHFLLVLDNLEQIRGAAADIAALLASCPYVKVLATSRVPLHVTGEQEFSLPPLKLPHPGANTPHELAQCPAVALFAQRARAVKSDFGLDAMNSTAVATICRRLDGLPLAIELAAARSKVLSPPALLVRLAHGLDVLSGGPRDQPDRLQTLRAAISWSYELLTGEEQSLFNQCAVFTGGFSLEAIEAVGQLDHGPEGPASSVFDMVASLVDNNLLYTSDATDGETRFAMLETVREYGLERLEASGDLEALRKRHAAYFLNLTEEAWPAFVSRIAIEPWLERFEASHDNFRAALKWAIERNEATTAHQLAGHLSWFWYLRGYLGEGRSWLERALAETTGATDRDRGLALHGIAVIAHWQGDDGRSVASLDEALPIWEHLGDSWGIINSLRMLGTAAEDTGDNEKAGPYFQAALRHARGINDLPNIGLILDHLGIITWGLGDATEAATYLEEALETQQSIGDWWGATISYSYLGLIACEGGDFEQANRYLRESLDLRWQMGIIYDIPHGIGNMATLASARGDYARAARLFGAADSMREGLGYSLKEPERTIYARAADKAKVGLGEGRYVDAWDAGRTLSAADAVQEALADTSEISPPRKSGAADDLTPRERDVLLLLVKGQTDRQIADALFISPRTAQGHVARLFDKLGVNTRTAAVAAALQADLVRDQTATQ